MNDDVDDDAYPLKPSPEPVRKYKAILAIASEANDMACGEETVYLGARSGWRSVGKPWALPRQRERGSKPDVDRWSRPDMRDVTMVFPCFEMDRVLHFLVPVKALFFFFIFFLLFCSHAQSGRWFSAPDKPPKLGGGNERWPTRARLLVKVAQVATEMALAHELPLPAHICSKSSYPRASEGSSFV